MAVQFRDIPAHVPIVPQSVGGLPRQPVSKDNECNAMTHIRVLDNFRVIVRIAKDSRNEGDLAFMDVLGQGQRLRNLEVNERRRAIFSDCSCRKSDNDRQTQANTIHKRHRE